MRTSNAFRITTVCVIVAMLIATVPANAESMRAHSDARHEAFVRGGDAIREALNQPNENTSLETPPVVVAASDKPAPEPARQETSEPGKGTSKLLWVGIGIGVAISAYLIQRSVTKHRRIFGPGF